MQIEEIFVISKGITEQEIINIKTFGVLADMLKKNKRGRTLRIASQT